MALRSIRKIKQGKELHEILLEREFMDIEDLSQAMQLAESQSKSLRQVLVENKMVSDMHMARALAEQYQVDFMDIASIDLDPDVAQKVSAKVARQFNILPIELSKKTLTVVLENPMDAYVLEKIKGENNLKILMKVAPRDQIMAALDKVYSQEEGQTDNIANLQLDVDSMLGNQSEEHLVIDMVDAILNEAAAKRASDIHIEPEAEYFRVRIRVDGALMETEKQEAGLHNKVVTRLKVLAGLDIAEKRQAQDGSFGHRYKGKDIELRLSTLPTVHGEKAVLRIIDTSALKVDFADLGMNKKQQEIAEAAAHSPFGLMLITGPTGSGKTTTVYSLLNEVNEEDTNIVTVEDPVEYNLERINQVHVNPKAGIGFTNALRAILRQDPDVIMVGEIRDKETAELACRASITGHLVVSTLHTNDAISTINRLVDMNIEPFLVSSSLIAVVAQRLVRKLCPDCRTHDSVTEDEARLLGSDQVQAGQKVYKASGCSKCNNTGYKGRLPLFEVLNITEDMRSAIVNNESASRIYDIASASDFIRMREHGAEKVLEGLTSVDEVLKATH